jgi:hypothetical protein
MKMKYLIISLFTVAVFFNSCGPSLQKQRDEIEKGLKSWVGKSETELVAKWGPPSNTYKLPDGSRELTYVYKHFYGSSRYAWRDYWGNLHFSRPIHNQVKTERGFTVDPSGTIIAYRWDGF